MSDSEEGISWNKKPPDKASLTEGTTKTKETNEVSIATQDECLFDYNIIVTEIYEIYNNELRP